MKASERHRRIKKPAIWVLGILYILYSLTVQLYYFHCAKLQLLPSFESMAGLQSSATPGSIQSPGQTAIPTVSTNSITCHPLTVTVLYFTYLVWSALVLMFYVRRIWIYLKNRSGAHKRLLAQNTRAVPITNPRAGRTVQQVTDSPCNPTNSDSTKYTTTSKVKQEKSVAGMDADAKDTATLNADKNINKNISPCGENIDRADQLKTILQNFLLLLESGKTATATIQNVGYTGAFIGPHPFLKLRLLIKQDDKPSRALDACTLVSNRLIPRIGDNCQIRYLLTDTPTVLILGYL